MSQLPKPATASRLPAPASSRLHAAASTARAEKRLRAANSPSAVSTAGGNPAKRSKPSGNIASASALSKSMMHLPTSSFNNQGFGSTFAAIKNVTGRASTVAVSRTAKNAAGRPAMNDRTNTEKTMKPPRAPKRQPWDLKGRLEDMEGCLKSTQERMGALESQNSQLQDNVEEKETVVQQSGQELDSLKFQLGSAKAQNEDLQRTLQSEKEKVRARERELEDASYAKSSLERRISSLDGELASKQAEANGLKAAVAEMSSSSAGLEAKLSSTKARLQDALEKSAALETLSADRAEAIAGHEERERRHETERRKLHNSIQELKGNIRVFCRVRPPPNEDELKHIAFAPGSKALEITRAPDSPSGSSTSVSGKGETFQFEFDHVFDTGAGQESVFDEVSQLVQSAVDGYNVCIFAYGQTGSGKTFTMEGGDDDEQEEEGIIPRTIRKIYAETRALADRGWEYKMEASFVEIYNEELRDLLATEKGLKYEIKRVDKKSSEIAVSNLRVEDVTSGENIGALLRRAKRNRAVAATSCNERSSRSHCVFVLKIAGSNPKTGESSVGCLNLVDLAGSERLKSSGSTGQRLEETKNINSSLSNLGKVILALANSKDGHGHIPYRDSKLTHLLMNSLGGNSKTLMFVNLSPREDSFGESLNSLRFAKRVNQCQIGTATKKVGGN